MKPFIAISIIGMLAACSGERATPDAVFSKSSDPRLTGATPAGSCSPLPAKVVLDFPYHLQSDYYYLNVKKMIRRSVVMAYLGEDTPSVDRKVRDAMLAAGFSLHDSKPEHGNWTHMRFSLKGYGMAHVILKPIASTGDGDSVVNGTLTFDLPPPQFNPPTKAKAPSAP